MCNVVMSVANRVLCWESREIERLEKDQKGKTGLKVNKGEETPSHDGCVSSSGVGVSFATISKRGTQVGSRFEEKDRAPVLIC